MLEGLIVLRMGDKDIAEAATTPAARGRGRGSDTSADRQCSSGSRPRCRAGGVSAKTNQFLKAEGVVAVFNRGSDTIMAAGGSDLSWRAAAPRRRHHLPDAAMDPRGADAGSGLPTVTLAVEHYNRMMRVLDKGVPVKVELNIETKFYDETTPNGFNTIAEIPGTDPQSEGRSRDARRALRFAGRCHRRHRQRGRHRPR